MKIQSLLLLILIWVIVVLFPLPPSLAQDFPDVCQQPENILANCNFDQGLNHWRPFLETGSAHIDFLQGGSECHAPLCPAAYIVSEHHFVGGIYQQVPVTKGNTYYANVVWLVFDSLVNDASINSLVGGIGRRIGIDPYGGTNSQAESVIWSEDNWRNDCKICNVEHVTVTAQADTITVFLRIDDTWKLRAAEKGHPVPPTRDQFWIDDIGLKQVAGDAAVQAPPPPEEPTPTEEPAPTEEPQPTVPPTSVPTDTPVPADTPLPTDTPERPTDTPEVSADTPEVPVDTPEVQADTLAPEVEAETEEIAQLKSAPAEEVSPAASATPAPPPTLTPTTRPSPTATLRPVRRNIVAPVAASPRSSAPAEAEASGLPLILGAAGTTACVGGVALIIAAVILAGLVWLYRLGWGDVNKDEADDEVIGVETAH